MGQKRKSRLYDRNGRWWADFRDFSDVGGKQEAMKPEGERMATKDRDLAEKLMGERLQRLRDKRDRRAWHGLENSASIGEYVTKYVAERARLLGKEKGVGAQHLKAYGRCLERAANHFGPQRDIASISPSEVTEWANKLRNTDNGRGGTYSEGTVRHHLNALSSLYRRAQGQEYVPVGYNPVEVMVDGRGEGKIKAAPAEWLEVHEAALLLEAARAFTHDRPDMANDGIYPIIATYLLTGGRKREVLGLEVRDVSFGRSAVRFRPNEHRGLKTENADRTVTLWPQLEEVLREWIYGGDGPRPEDALLFPSTRTGKMIRDLRKSLDAIGKAAGWEEGDIRTKMFRHTYCSARLQTLDHGRPIAKYTVGREMGHGGSDLVERVYSHLGEVRHRGEAVEYRTDTIKRIEDKRRREEFTARLKALKVAA